MASTWRRDSSTFCRLGGQARARKQTLQQRRQCPPRPRLLSSHPERPETEEVTGLCPEYWNPLSFHCVKLLLITPPSAPPRRERADLPLRSTGCQHHREARPGHSCCLCHGPTPDWAPDPPQALTVFLLNTLSFLHELFTWNTVLTPIFTWPSPSHLSGVTSTRKSTLTKS